MENGNRRAIWKDGGGNRLALQFLGEGMVQCVLFKQRGWKLEISRVTGRDTLGGLKSQIDAFDLRPILC